MVCVHTILQDNRHQFNMGLLGAYDVLANELDHQGSPRLWASFLRASSQSRDRGSLNLFGIEFEDWVPQQ